MNVNDRSSRFPDEAEVARIIERYRPDILGELRSALEGRNVAPYTLMRYHLGWEDRQGRSIEGRTGKLLRPALCLLCCEAVGGEAGRALPAAAALELLHNFSLIHDDVEDASLQRHGRETLWSLWGEAQAINVGDGMFALAHGTLLRLVERGHPTERVLQAIQMLDDASLRLCEGQQRDLEYAEERLITRADYQSMIEGKTAALLAASGALGALLGGATPEGVEALEQFGRRLGLAFQIRDDVLGVWGDSEETGKPTGDDLRGGKKSYPVVIGLERAAYDERQALLALVGDEGLDIEGVHRARTLLDRLDAREESERAALQHADAAIAALALLELVPEPRAELEQLARFAAQRRT